MMAPAEHEAITLDVVNYMWEKSREMVRSQSPLCTHTSTSKIPFKLKPGTFQSGAVPFRWLTTT